MVGRYAKAIDLVQSEYGWTDDVILDLRLARFQQIVSAIQLRRYAAFRERSSMVSWQTRILGQFTAGGYMLAKGQQNKPLEYARTLGFDPIERVLAGGTEESGTAAKENKAGSFERLMGWANGGMKRRG